VTTSKYELIQKVLEKPWIDRLIEAKQRGEYADEDVQLIQEWCCSPTGIKIYKETGEVLEDFVKPVVRKKLGVDAETIEKIAKLEEDLYHYIAVEKNPEKAIEVLNELEKLLGEV